MHMLNPTIRTNIDIELPSHWLDGQLCQKYVWIRYAADFLTHKEGNPNSSFIYTFNELV